MCSPAQISRVKHMFDKDAQIIINALVLSKFYCSLH